MLQRFCQYITQNQLFLPEQKVLLAVSGGMDSVAMCHLFHKAGFNFAIAHCNFGLRGEESEEDEAFVQKLAKKYKVNFFVQHFDTAAFAEKEKISIQMAARQLRYEWFHIILQKNNLDFIATAHHQNDVLETILLNLTKGTGIAGLHGISAKMNKIIRPLLFAGKDDLREYFAEEQLSWREDSSNESVKYQRNLIRSEVIPVLKKINPNLENTITQTTEKISAVEKIFNARVEELRRSALKEENNITFINIDKINSVEEPGIILYELLRVYNFNYQETLNILSSNEIGKKIESPTHIAVKDRTDYVITGKNLEEFIGVMVEEGLEELKTASLHLLFSSREKKNFNIPSSKDIACIDFNKLKFPLQVRKWKEGDWFCPLGMNKKKKISDFLIDQKVPLNLKGGIKLMLSGNSIVWVIGYRVDDRFKVSEQTEKILVITKENI